MRTGILGLLAAFAAGLGACGQGPEVVPASFTEQPTAADVAEVYPAFARMARIPGRVTLSCGYDEDGSLHRCRRLSITPDGLNFEKAIPQLMGKYNVIPETVDGRPSGAPVVFTIAFNPTPAPAPYTGPAPTAAELAMARRSLEYFTRYDGQRLQQEASRTVGLDRMSQVAAMVDRAYASEGAARTQAMPAALVMAMTPGDRRALTTRSGYWYAQVTEPQMERVSPEYHAANARLAARIRAEYCAAYPCALDTPAAPAAKGR